MNNEDKLIIQEVIDNLLYIKDIDIRIKYTDELKVLNFIYSKERDKELKSKTIKNE